MKKYQPFRFKQFEIHQQQSTMKVGTDGVLLGAWANVDGAKRILDIGTGTGLIALMAAQRNEKANIDAVEIDTNAFEEAAYNFNKSTWSHRLNIFNQSIQDFSETYQLKYDVIISNPPYFINSTKSHNFSKNQVRHTDSLSFDELITAVSQLLSDSGRFSLILPNTEGEHFYHLAKANQLHCSRKVRVRGRADKPVERLLMEFSKEETYEEEGEFVIQKSSKRHDYTAAYINLTKDYYLFM